jgi:deoxyribose-phosphate aldolase
MTKKQPTATERLAEAQAELVKLEAELDALYAERIIDGAQIAAVSAHIAVLQQRVADLTPKADAEALEAKRQAQEDAYQAMLKAGADFRTVWTSSPVVADLEALLEALRPVRDEVRTLSYQAKKANSAVAQGVLSDMRWLEQLLAKMRHVGLG